MLYSERCGCVYGHAVRRFRRNGKEQRELYRDSGIAHLLAVSGQHLSVIGGGVYLILRKLGFGFTGAGAVGAFLVLNYGLLTGGSGSAMRAVIMILCLWLAKKREGPMTPSLHWGWRQCCFCGSSPIWYFRADFSFPFLPYGPLPGREWGFAGFWGWKRLAEGRRCKPVHSDDPYACDAVALFKYPFMVWR